MSVRGCAIAALTCLVGGCNCVRTHPIVRFARDEAKVVSAFAKATEPLRQRLAAVHSEIDYRKVVFAHAGDSAIAYAPLTDAPNRPRSNHGRAIGVVVTSVTMRDSIEKQRLWAGAYLLLEDDAVAGPILILEDRSGEEALVIRRQQSHAGVFCGIAIERTDIDGRFGITIQTGSLICPLEVEIGSVIPEKAPSVLGMLGQKH